MNFKLMSLMQMPCMQLSKRTTIITEIIQLTPTRHSDHTKLRNYIERFWNVLSTVNKDHKDRGHRQSTGIKIIRGIHFIFK